MVMSSHAPPSTAPLVQSMTQRSGTKPQRIMAMDHSSLARLLSQSVQQIPDTLAAICVDLNSGEIVACETSGEETTEPAEIARAATALFRSDQQTGLGRLWERVSGSGEHGDEIILLEPDQCFVFLRSGVPRDFAIVFVTARSANVGLVIARSRSVRDTFDEALR